MYFNSVSVSSLTLDHFIMKISLFNLLFSSFFFFLNVIVLKFYISSHTKKPCNHFLTSLCNIHKVIFYFHHSPSTRLLIKYSPFPVWIQFIQNLSYSIFFFNFFCENICKLPLRGHIWEVNQPTIKLLLYQVFINLNMLSSIILNRIMCYTNS